MSRPQYGNDMDQPSTADIIRRARERAEAGIPREDYDTFLRRQAAMSSDPSDAPSIPPRNRPPRGPQGGGPPRQQPRPQAPPGFQNKDGQINLPISRPAPVPQWPLPGPLVAPASPSNSEPYRPPAGSQPPQRPPRPSKVPSILDASRLQDHTPVFQYEPQNNRDSEIITTTSALETQSTLSRPSTVSSAVSIPDFPLPTQAPVPPPMGLPRRSVNLGPPPSARRGASSFYSHLSYVSPIPEESPRSRSYASYASSAAMPESWGTPSPAQSPRYPDAYYDDVIAEEGSLSETRSVHEDGDESRLVRSASIGRRGKAALVTTGTQEVAGPAEEDGERPSPTPLQPSPFPEGTGYLDASSNSSSTVPSARDPNASPVGAALTADSFLNAYDAASATNPRAPKRMSLSPQPPPAAAQQPRGFSRLSAIRRPPRLDMDAVREAEARGSITSLPDLIRRATRLAASLDRGKRPASRFNDLDDFPPEFYGDGTKLTGIDKDYDEYYDKHQSGLSDMLAAFPPPAQAQSRQGGTRQSFRDSVLSWPLPPFNRSNNNLTPRGPPGEMAFSDSNSKKKGRRCCGLPLWGFITLIFVITVVIAAAVVIPIEFFLIRKQNVTGTMAAAEQQCKSQVTCQNGGTNVVTDGICACVCTNGFTGFDCSTPDTVGCTSANISGNTNIDNVTVGDAIPRLISQAQTSFSLSLSGTAILSKLNAGNLSCTAENALVTFDGQSTSGTTGMSEVLVEAAAVKDDSVATITVMAGQSSTTTLTIDITSSADASSAAVTTIPPTTTITITKTFTSIWPPASSTAAVTTTSMSSVSSSAPSPSSTFTATDEVLDFARVSVLYILQQDTLADATTAQSMLQMFFASTTTTIAAASNISLSAGNSIDLVNFHIDTGMGPVGSMPSTSSKRAFEKVEINLWNRHWTGPL
ncbi:hypothetical protein VM1G_08989 [Cytospora mali]|uniref:EGF-like domain-containing protein n=1 Tax=Cytospora mali TaxID=578113 RepID=A0A194WAX3_CYTMA|nr:hypothetical protein VM1G_08989 [Valsa mali]